MQTAFAGLTAIGVYQSIKQLGDAFYDVTKQGAQFVRVMDSFKIMTDLNNESYKEMLGTLRTASRGTVTDMELMLSANKALSLGVAQTKEEMAQLVQVSTVLGRRTGLGQEQSLERLLVGIGRISPRILDDLGIAVNLTQLYADATGKLSSELSQEEKIHILLNKVLEDGLEIIEKYPDGLEDAMSGVERFGVAWENLKSEIGQSPLSRLITDAMSHTAKQWEESRISANALKGEGSLSETAREVEKVTDRYEELIRIREHLFGVVGDAVFVDPVIRRTKEELDEIVATYRALELAEAGRARANLAKPQEPDYGLQAEVSGKQILQLMDDLAKAQQNLDVATVNGNTKAAAAAQTKVDLFQSALTSMVYLYNVAAEELEQEQIDPKGITSATLEVLEAAQAFDIFVEAEKKADLAGGGR